MSYVLAGFPRTDPQIATRLAEWADHNPYALRLMLGLPRVVDSVHDGAITLAAAEIDLIRGGLSDLLGEHWSRLSIGVQQILVVASLLGQSVHDDVLRAGLARLPLTAGLDDAFASAWIRPAATTHQIVEFVERLRYEIARDRVPGVLDDQARKDVLVAALHALRSQLELEQALGVRRGRRHLHITLARAEIETDFLAAARTTRELADLARVEHRRLDAITYLTEAIGWLERLSEPPRPVLVEALCELSLMQRIEYSDSRSGEPAAFRAFGIAEAHLSAHDEVRICATLRLARSRRVISDPAALSSAIRTLRAGRSGLYDASHAALGRPDPGLPCHEGGAHRPSGR